MGGGGQLGVEKFGGKAASQGEAPDGVARAGGFSPDTGPRATYLLFWGSLL